MRELILTLLFLVSIVHLSYGQELSLVSGERGGELHYPVNEPATVYASPNSSDVVDRVEMRRALYVTDQIGGWYQVRLENGTKGYVRRSNVSSYWIRVSKEDRAVYLYEGTKLKRRVVADFGYNAFADKVQRGSDLLRDHWRTPEGAFYVVNRNPHSMYYKAFVLNYPRPSDAKRGLANGMISQSQHDAIIEADRKSQMPPMSTPLGGWIEIHGGGTNSAANWTRGCVAVHNDEMDELWRYVRVGTPVLIE